MDQKSYPLEQSPRLTWGVMAFATMLFIPFALAIVIYIGAFVVSDDVYAAKSAGLDDTVAGWKHNLVGVCPLH